MKTIQHKAATRGVSKIDWLDSKHTFSFSNYYDPERIHFGALRVLNDDTVAPDKGFGKHPHQNMEIISIPLEGVLKHNDSHGHSGAISKGEVQIMSAGTGVYHSEMNGSDRDPVKFLQIWIIPNKMNVEPRYAQKKFDLESKKNDFLTIVSPEGSTDKMWIHQNATFNWANFEKGNSKEYSLHNRENGLYIFVLKGNLDVEGILLEQRDGMGIYETEKINITAQEDSEFLLMEVPMI